VSEGGGGMANGPARSEIGFTKRPLSLYTVAIFYSSSCVGIVILYYWIHIWHLQINTGLQNLLNSLGARGGKIHGI